MTAGILRIAGVDVKERVDRAVLGDLLVKNPLRKRAGLSETTTP